MQKYSHAAVLLLLGSVFSPGSQAADPVAVVNGEPITVQDVEQFQEDHDLDDRERVVDELIARKLLLQEAQKDKLDQRPQVQERIEKARREILVSAAVDDIVAKLPVSEEALKTQYEALKPRLSHPELKARHILVESREKAADLIAKLQKGASFATLANEHTTDPSGKNNGGDLGWFEPNQMVPAFATAAGQLKPGEYTKEPVQTPFGWHVILLENTRTSEPPAFEEIEPQLRQMAERHQVGRYIEQLQAKAKIERPEPKKEEPTAEKK